MCGVIIFPEYFWLKEIVTTGYGYFSQILAKLNVSCYLSIMHLLVRFNNNCSHHHGTGIFSIFIELRDFDYHHTTGKYLMCGRPET